MLLVDLANIKLVISNWYNVEKKLHIHWMMALKYSSDLNIKIQRIRPLTHCPTVLTNSHKTQEPPFSDARQ